VLVKLTGSAVQAAKRDRRVADDNPDNRTITLMETKETSMQMNSDVTSAERIKQQVRLAFQEFDKDGSKSLEKPEVAALLKQLGQQLSDQELDKAMAAMDTEGARDNKIELSEFEIWFEERQTSRFQILRAGVEFEARRIVGSDKPINIQVQQDQSNLRTSQRKDFVNPLASPHDIGGEEQRRAAAAGGGHFVRFRERTAAGLQNFWILISGRNRVRCVRCVYLRYRCSNVPIQYETKAAVSRGSAVQIRKHLEAVTGASKAKGHR
jgi:hypothetical protein